MNEKESIPFNLKRAFRHVGRGLLLKCPNCGQGGLFRKWVIMRETCPRCHLILDRGEQDYFLGGYVINFVTAEFTIAFIALGVVLMTWPTVPWTALKWGLISVMIPGPAITYPFSKTVWLGIDLTLRPITLKDLDGHGENELWEEPAAAS